VSSDEVVSGGGRRERANGSGRVVEVEERERCSNLALGRSS
jgi:hypothetical protein